MIKLIKNDTNIVFEYESDQHVNWIHNNLESTGSTYIKRNFMFKKSDFVEYEEDPEDFDYNNPFYIQFIFAELIDEYYKIEKYKLMIDYDIYFSKGIDFGISMFVAEKNISIFKKINNIISEDLYIGGKNENAIPTEAFYEMISNFPNEYEIKKYINARLSVVLNEYLTKTEDHLKKYEKYLNKKISHNEAILLKAVGNTEKAKYQLIFDKLTIMLSKENEYNEKSWQMEILEIIQLLFPKYIKVFREAPVRDPYSNTIRNLDYLLVDSKGNIDLIEIKRPSSSSFLSVNTYRDNFVPLKSLSGTIMQIEKYILYLNKWGSAGEKYLTKKYQDQLPDSFSIKILNPGAILILGRSNNLSNEQIIDLEIIKRKYKNVIDIITYDNLLERLKLSIDIF